MLGTLIGTLFSKFVRLFRRPNTDSRPVSSPNTDSRPVSPNLIGDEFADNWAKYHPHSRILRADFVKDKNITFKGVKYENIEYCLV